MKRSPLVVIFTTVFIDLIGFGIVIPVLPFYAEGSRFNATPRTVGLLFASYSVMQLIFSPILGRLSDKHGRRPVLLISIIGTGIGFLILGFATTLWMLFVGRILDGITGGNISTAQAYIADITTKEDRAKGMGLIGAAFGLALFSARRSAAYCHWGVAYLFFRCRLVFRKRYCFTSLCQKRLRLIIRLVSLRPVGEAWSVSTIASNPRLGYVLIIYFMFIVAFNNDDCVFALHVFRLATTQRTQAISRLRHPRSHSWGGLIETGEGFCELRW